MLCRPIVSYIKLGRLFRGYIPEKIGRGIITTLLWKIGGMGKGWLMIRGKIKFTGMCKKKRER